MGSDMMVSQESKWLSEELSEAKEILRLAYDMLCNITTDDFSKGKDKPVRDKIADFLEIEDE